MKHLTQTDDDDDDEVKKWTPSRVHSVWTSEQSRHATFLNQLVFPLTLVRAADSSLVWTDTQLQRATGRCHKEVWRFFPYRVFLCLRRLRPHFRPTPAARGRAADGDMSPLTLGRFSAGVCCTSPCASVPPPRVLLHVRCGSVRTPLLRLLRPSSAGDTPTALPVRPVRIKGWLAKYMFIVDETRRLEQNQRWKR